MSDAHLHGREKEFSYYPEWPLIIYLLSYGFYKFLLDTPFASGFGCIWHYIRFDTLAHDLWGSLYFLHAQPPLMNLLLGAIAIYLPGYQAVILECSYFLIGALSICMLDKTYGLLQVRPIVRLLLAAWLCLFPTFHLYVNWGYTTQLEFFFCSLLVYMLARYCQTKRLTFGHGLRLSLLCTALGFLRPQWHPILCMSMAAIVLCMRWRTMDRWSYAKGFCVGLMPSALLFLKNALLFGVFGASSWFGMNMATVTRSLVPQAEIAQLQKKGEISPYFPVDFNYNKALRTAQSWEAAGRSIPHYTHPVLANQAGKYNAQEFITGSKQDGADSLVIIQHFPYAYARHTLRAFYNALITPSLAFNNCGLWLANIRSLRQEYYALPELLRNALSIGSVMLYGVVPLSVAWHVTRCRKLRMYRTFVYAGLWVAVAIILTSCMFNYGEHIRMRWGTAPIYLCFAALFAEFFLRSIKAMRTPMAESLPAGE